MRSAAAQAGEYATEQAFGVFSHQNQLIRVPQRLRFREACRSGLRPGRATGPRAPAGEILIEQAEFRFVEANQHDPDIVEPERAFGGLAYSLLLQGQLEPERTALTWGAFKANLSIHQLNQLLRDRRAEPGAAVTPGGRIVCLSEALEYALLGVGRDADPRVLDGEAQTHRVIALTLARDRQRDPAGLGEFDAVADQVVEDLSKVIRIAAQSVWNLGHDVSVEVEPADLRLMREHSGGAVDQCVQIKICFLDINLAGLDLRDVEHVLDQFEHRARRFVHRFQHFRLLRI